MTGPLFSAISANILRVLCGLRFLISLRSWLTFATFAVKSFFAAASEAERRLQFQLTNRCLAGERASRKRDRSAEVRRGHNTNRRSQILAVEHVARIHTEGQVVTPIRRARTEDGRHAGTRAASEATTTSSSTASVPTTSSAASAWSASLRPRAGSVCRRSFPAKPERLTETQIQCELWRARQIVDRHTSIPGRWSAIVETWVSRERARTRKGWTIVVERIAIQIRTHGDVIRYARGRDHERAEPEPIRGRNGAAHKCSMTDAIHGAAIILIKVVLVRGESAGRVGIHGIHGVGDEKRRVARP